MLDSVLLVMAVLALLGLLGYYLLIRTEGVYLGWRVVVWLYDVYASRYDRTKNYDHTYESLFLARPIISRLAGQPAPLILDVATGTGRVPHILFEQDDFHGRVFGLDLSRRMLFHAAVKLFGYRGRYELLWYTASELPFPDDTFDLVTCIEALEFLPQPDENLVELTRVLRPGGTLLITNRKGADARLMPGKIKSRDALRDRLVELGMEAVESEIWQVDYDLFWARKRGSSAPTGSRPLAEVLRCPGCGAVEMLPLDSGDWVCMACERRAPTREDGVIELLRMCE